MDTEVTEFYATYEKDLADAAEFEIKQVEALVNKNKRVYYVHPSTRDRFIIHEMWYTREGDKIDLVIKCRKEYIIEHKSVILYKDWEDLMKSIGLERDPFVVKSKVMYTRWQRENARESRFK